MKRCAFSLIELSIAILIIGILVAGVTQSTNLIKSFRLQTAQNLTQSSPVHSISNLVLWYETSLENSFDIAEQENNSSVTNWYDINSQLSVKNNATQATAASKPLLIKNIFNNALSGIRFDGSNDSMSFNGAILVGTSYTIFVVEQRRTSAIEKYFIGGSGMNNANLILGYRSNTVMTQAHYLNDLDVTISGLTTPTPAINTFWFSGSVGGGKKYWRNGGLNPLASGTGSTHETPLTSYAGAGISGYSGSLYNGDIGEIIIFNRALKNEERQMIEVYLGKKFNIKLN